MATALRNQPTEVVWKAQPKQVRFLRDYADVFEVLYGGAAGGGKSDALLIFQIMRRQNYPGTTGLFLRRQYAELSKARAAIHRSKELLTGTGAQWNGAERTWTFPNGSRLEFGHMQHTGDELHYQSAAYEDICFDELTHFPEDQYLFLFSRARTTNPAIKPAIRAASNPGSIGHGWVKSRFIDPMPPGEVRSFLRVNDRDRECAPDHPKARSRAFLPAQVYDNLALLEADPGYIATLEALPEDDRRALLEGDWDAWFGNVFKRWRRDRHVVRPFELPTGWERSAGLDWGVTRPFVCLWLARGTRLEDDPPPLARCDQYHHYVYREVAQTQLLDEQMAQKVVALSKGERIARWLADPGSFFVKNNQSGISPALVFRKHGVTLTPANNDRLYGKRAVDAALGDCACGVPRLRVFETCLELVRTLPGLPYDPHQVEDVDTDAEDDTYDALRYALMGPGRGPSTGPQRIEWK